jgi:putative oxidoreductase
MSRMVDYHTAPFAALLLRLTSGVAFLAHGLFKLLVITPAGTVLFFGKLGLPPMLAYAVIVAEIVAGLMLVLGVYARWVALLLIPDLLGAILFVNGSKGWAFSSPGGGWEFPAFWAAALAVQALLGDGAYALKPSPVVRAVGEPPTVST